MNRGTVVFLTLVLLLTHTLAIHQTPDGDFAAPYEAAHVAYRIGRNLVHAGVARWDPATPAADSYPSLAWIGLAALAARVNIGPNVLSQYVGLFSALATIVLLAQFSAKRMAGLIAPLLLAASGSAAAAGASGTEAPAAMLLVTAAFLAFERGWRWPMSSALVALAFTGTEGLVFLLALLLLEIVDRPTERARYRSVMPAFAVALGGVLLCLFVRRAVTGTYFSSFERLLVSFDTEQFRLGLHYLWSFVFASGFGLLLPLPFIAVFTGHLSPRGRRAGLLVCAWFGMTLATGGDRIPFWNALAPVLPLLFLAIQDTMKGWMDARPRLAAPCWSLLVATLAACFLVSKLPGDLGPIPLEGLLSRWMSPPALLEEAFGHTLGREGLLEEIREVETLRPLGVFLRDKVRADATILTFWPGAIGYLSRKDVIDTLGRVTPPPGTRRTGSWRGLPRIDLLAAIESEPDYIVPLVGALEENATPTDFLRRWLRRWDVVGEEEGRLQELIAALRLYELIAVPVPARDAEPEIPSPYPFLLLRKRSLNLGPQLQLEREGDRFDVLVKHNGHRQVVDLYIALVDRDEQVWTMRPTGEWVQKGTVAARSSLLMHNTGSRTIHAASGHLPSGVEVVAVSISLHNPGLTPGVPFSGVGLAVHERLPR